MLKFILKIALLFTVALFTSPCRSQLAPTTDEAPVSNAPLQKPDETHKPVLEQDVNLVNLYFTVKDSNGNLVPNLEQQNCSLLDDNVQQTFLSFTEANNEPLNFGILVDTSANQISWLPNEQDAGSQFIHQVMRREDQGFLISFDVNVNLLEDYTNSPQILTRAFYKAQIDSGGGVPAIKDIPGGPIPNPNPPGEHFYDAIYQAANEKIYQLTGRKAMIVLTDGNDQGSSFASQDAVVAAEKNNISVFVIWSGYPKCFDIKDRRITWVNGYPRETVPDHLPRKSPPQTQQPQVTGLDECSAVHWLNEACPGYYAAKCFAEHTGGRFIMPENSKQLEHAFQTIQDELHSQYKASYTPSDINADGHFHRLELQCHADDGKDLKVQMRRGYFAPLAEK